MRRGPWNMAWVSETGDDLMSQPTLSRLENAPSWRQPGRMGLSMIDLSCASFRAVPERIVLDIDDTDDAVHGGPQLALFNAHYDEYIFQPIHIFEATTGKPVLPLLRPGKRPSGEEATSKGCDVRFVVTNLPGRAEVLYEKVYCARGRMENMIKDNKLYTKSDHHPATAGRPTSSACSCTPAPTGYCTNFARPRPAARCGARRRSKPSAAPSSRSPGASRSSNPASGSPCRQPIHIGRLSCRWPVGYKPKAPEPSGRCRRINPEHQPPTSLKIRL